MSEPKHDDNINTLVRDWVAELEHAVDDTSLIVDQRLLERVIGLSSRFAKLHKEGPQRLKQAPSARKRRPATTTTGRTAAARKRKPTTEISKDEPA